MAVDEALKKLKGRYPECDIVRHVSAHAVNSVMDSSKDLTQHARRDEFTRQLAIQPVLAGVGGDSPRTVSSCVQR